MLFNSTTLILVTEKKYFVNQCYLSHLEKSLGPARTFLGGLSIWKTTDAYVIVLYTVAYRQWHTAWRVRTSEILFPFDEHNLVQSGALT
jgi:hypothetical protein